MEHQSAHRGAGEEGALGVTPMPEGVTATPGSATICAIATAAGRGGVGIVRLSGPRVREIGVKLLGRAMPAPRVATLASFLDESGEPLDQGLALFFEAPHSYTGEDVLELHAHGGPVLLHALVARAVALGALPAKPGEFTQRAFLNDKLDLAQAEAVADLIDAGSLAAARAALRSLQGEFSQRVHDLVAALTDLRVWVEAAIDFPEEEIDFLADERLHARLAALRAQFNDLIATAQRGRLLREGMTVVIAGRPNAGKSSLLNALAGHEAAIVTDIAGTTRDIVKEYLAIDGMPLHVLDTAGLRQASDVVEAEGVRRARAEIARADRVLFVIDAVSDPEGQAWREEGESFPKDIPVTLVFNKADLATPVHTDLGASYSLSLSAKTGIGMQALREHLKQCMGYEAIDAGTLSARARHLTALGKAQQHVDTAATLLSERREGELAAEELRLAQLALGDITGDVHSDDLLGRIFSSFCIGK
jgi:tRNA modification GTPase